LRLWQTINDADGLGRIIIMDEGLREAIALAAPDATRPLAIEVLIGMARQCQGFARQARAQPTPNPAAAKRYMKLALTAGRGAFENESGRPARSEAALHDRMV
jgi:hypothetical protein